MRSLLPIFFIIWWIPSLYAQGLENKIKADSVYREDISHLSNKRVRTFFHVSDSVLLDSLNIIPGSLVLMSKGSILPDTVYVSQAPKARVYLKGKYDSLTIHYRVYPFSLDREYYNKDVAQILSSGNRPENPFIFKQTYRQFTPKSSFGKIQRRGSISRSFGVGNNRDLSVNSNLNLQLSGKLSENIHIRAAISDNNIPIQANGNTHQLQEFDRIYIEMYDKDWSLLAGDFVLQEPKSYFMRYQKKAQGLQGGVFHDFGKVLYRGQVSAGVSKGKFTRNTIVGVEGNQGPYRLKGKNGETFITVLSGTERIFIDGILMERGLKHDYVIDYNTAEITFTARRLITKDSRIIVEFQYSDRNYVRSLVHTRQELKHNKMSWNVELFSEQDAKNQPLLQDLNDAQKLQIASVGDNTGLATFSTITEIAEIADEVYYKLIDSLGYDSVLVYTNNPDSIKYKASFIFVGAGNGNYEPMLSAANGRTFKWIVPVSGVLQGSYAPLVQMVAPTMHQQAILSGDYAFNKAQKIGWEATISRYDANTYSLMDKKNDIGNAGVFYSDFLFPFQKDTSALQFLLGHRVEINSNNFTAIERYRNVEFIRDWNIQNTEGALEIMEGYAGVSKREKYQIKYTYSSLNDRVNYQGDKHRYNGYVKKGKLLMKSDGSILHSSGDLSSKYLRNNSLLQLGFKKVTVSLLGLYEDNKRFNTDSNSINSSSFSFFEWESKVENSQKAKSNYFFSYGERTDKLPGINELFLSSHAQNMKMSYGTKFKKHTIVSLVNTYRRLRIVNDQLTTIKPDENVLSTIQVSSKLAKQLLVVRGNYEVGSGLEVRRGFSFIEVQPGQGTHTFLGDLNGNQLSDVDEFSVAAFQDEAHYIKVFIPTNEYIKVYNNTVGFSSHLRPEVFWANKKGSRLLLSRLSHQMNYKNQEKTTNANFSYNPFVKESDTSIVTSQEVLNNAVYFNRNKGKVSFTVQQNKAKNRSLLTSGITTRSEEFFAYLGRWNILSSVALNGSVREGTKVLTTPLVSSQNFQIDFLKLEADIQVQTSRFFRLKGLVMYAAKRNQMIYGGEESEEKRVGVELNYMAPKKGRIVSSFNFSEIIYPFTENSILQYEMLEGLNPGNNMIWELQIQRKIAKHLQLNIQYNGRYNSVKRNTIHNGTVQIRATF